MATPTRRAIGATPSPVKAEDPIVDPAVEPTPVTPEPVPAEEPKIEPVDVESPDYLAGRQNAIDGVDVESVNYKAGYAAGLGEAGSGTAAPSEPAPTSEPAAGRGATVHELRKLAPDDNGFVIDQLGINATLPQATAAYCARLNTRLKAETEARVQAEKKLAAETQSPAPVRTARGAVEPTAPVDQTDPKAMAAAEWKSNHNNCQGDFVNESAYIGFRKAELQNRAAHRPK